MTQHNVGTRPVDVSLKPFELQPKVLKGSYIGDYIGDYEKGY